MTLDDVFASVVQNTQFLMICGYVIAYGLGFIAGNQR